MTARDFMKKYAQQKDWYAAGVPHEFHMWEELALEFAEAYAAERVKQLEARLEKLQQELSEIQGFVHNREHTICQGGHHQHCDCLGRLLDELCGAALSGVTPEEPRKP